MLRLITALLLAPTAAAAQSAPPADWELIRVPDQDSVFATINFTNGLILTARCQAGVYDLFVMGLPEAPRGKITRDISIQVGEDDAPRTTVWTVGSERTVAFSRIPAMVARDLAEGGKLQIVVPGEREGQPRTRYVMDVEPSSTAIEQTLTTCDRPLIDPREALSREIEGNGQDGLPAAVTWRTAPRPSFPPAVNGRSPRQGYAVFSCVATEEGELSACQTESEQPAGYKLGQSVERALPRARLRLTEQGVASGYPLEGRMIVFSVNFRIEP